MGYAFTEFHNVDLLRLLRSQPMNPNRRVRKRITPTLTIVFLT
jgi:hypothetical protein